MSKGVRRGLDLDSHGGLACIYVIDVYIGVDRRYIPMQESNINDFMIGIYYETNISTIR